MADADRLQIAHSGDEADHHFLNFALLPVDALLFALSEHIFEVGAVVHELSDQTHSEGVVHGFVEIVAVEMNDICVVLGFGKLDCFLFILVEFLEVLGLDFFERVDLAAGQVFDLVDFGVLLAGPEQVDFLEVLLSKHFTVMMIIKIVKFISNGGNLVTDGLQIRPPALLKMRLQLLHSPPQDKIFPLQSLQCLDLPALLCQAQILFPPMLFHLP